MKKLFPIVNWASQYNRMNFGSDLVAAMIVIIMLIPQSLAYALLAGLPPEVGLYATILPLLLYACFGTSSTLSVAPAAITSLLTVTTLDKVVTGDSTEYLAAAILLALLSGTILIALGMLKQGFISNFLSRPVLTGFISSAAILIALSQTKHLLGVEAQGSNLISLSQSLETHLSSTSLLTLTIGLCCLMLLAIFKSRGMVLVSKLGIQKDAGQILVKTAPFLIIICSTLFVYSFNLSDFGVSIVGDIPGKLPDLALPVFNFALIEQLIVPAIIISLVTFVESLSIGKVLATKRQEKIQSNQELIALGAANVGSAVSGGFPVAASLSRSMVNFEAGARTQAASIFSAFGVALAAVWMTPFLYYLPKATLAAIIIVAVLPLVNFTIIRDMWSYSKKDFYAALVTILATLLLGIEAGVVLGVFASLSLYLYKTSKPHIAEVGLIEGTEIFKNIERYEVITDPTILSLRVDEGLYFANEYYLEEKILNRVIQDSCISHVVLMCNAVNDIDFSALKMLEGLNKKLNDRGITLHLSEIKGPVLDVLERTTLLKQLTGKLYQTQFEAFTSLSIR